MRALIDSYDLYVPIRLEVFDLIGRGLIRFVYVVNFDLARNSFRFSCTGQITEIDVESVVKMDTDKSLVYRANLYSPPFKNIMNRNMNKQIIRCSAYNSTSPLK